MHPHHMGVVEIEYDSPKNELQIACKWFVDDLEDAIHKRYSVKKDLVRSVDSIPTDSILIDYLNANLDFKNNTEKLSLECIGAEHEKGSLWIYFVVKKFTPGKQLEIKNQVLCNRLKDQFYIVHVANKIKKSTYRSNCNSPIIVHKW